MASRQINILKIVNDIIKYTDDTLPDTMTNFADVLINKSAELWSVKAKNASPWGSQYSSTLKTEKTSSGSSVFVDEQHKNYYYVNMVENGVKSWSIKDALLNGKAARRNQAKYGRVFVIVPFRHRTPGRTKSTSSFSGVLPNDIYEQAKSGVTFGKDYGKLAGLKRYGSEKHGKFLTFRMVTQKTKGWIYPSKPATPVFNEVADKTEEMIRKSIIKMAQGFSKDVEKNFK